MIAAAAALGAPPPAEPRRLRWGYRLKVPLALTVAAMVAGVAVATTTYLLVYRYVEANAVAQTQRLARTLARSLVQPVLSNDVWQAFQTVRASHLATPPGEVPTLQIVVIDAQAEVFVALDPQAYPPGMSSTRLPAALAVAARWIGAADGAAPYAHDDVASRSLVVAERLVGEEDALVGGVIVQQEHGITRAQAREVAQRLAVLGAATILVVAVLGWIGGRRLIRPLEKLRAAMNAAPATDVRPAVAEVSRLNDEVGDLGKAFLSMMEELDAKRALERDMLQAERMASIGRLTAGIAHEVNNPLGGMLAAIQNRRLRGKVDEYTENTLALLERGLDQIHSTVIALLHEARRETHELRVEDLHDLYLLLRPEADQAECAIEWLPQVPAAGQLSSVPIRQILLNLTLNAIAAAGAGGRVRVHSQEADGVWRVTVANSGATLDSSQLDELLAGRMRADGGQLGLGLWITARVLHALGGTLSLEPPDPPAGISTVLCATLPLSTP